MTAGGSGVASLRGVSLRYGEMRAADDVSLDIPANCMVGLIGPDGVGKFSLLVLLVGARRMQSGEICVLDDDVCDRRHRRAVRLRIAYTPQGLGKNLYPTFSVFENVDFFGWLFGHDEAERERCIVDLPQGTGSAPFAERSVGKLSGGMKQRLGLCYALIHGPGLLTLDGPTTGVDPLSRNQFWELIGRTRVGRESMSVLVATVHMEEAERFDRLVATDDGKVLVAGTPQESRERIGTQSLESTFIALLSESKRAGYHRLVIPPQPQSEGASRIATETEGPTCRFGNFVAADHISFRIERGEIFGFLGFNGCGKLITMKTLTGLLPAGEGTCALFGRVADVSDIATRRRTGYMFQAFSLCAELSVRQNLVLHVRLFHLPADGIPARIGEALRRFDLEKVADELPDDLPPGTRQCLLLAVAVIRKPKILILDEPISRVDPVARNGFWELTIEPSHRDGVTIFISIHFMNKAQHHNRISLMHTGKILASGTPDELVHQRGLSTLEATFIAYLEEAAGAVAPAQLAEAPIVAEQPGDGQGRQAQRQCFSPLRLFSYVHCGAMELRRGPIRPTLALLGTALLMFIIDYGINIDAEDLSWVVLDRDQTTISQAYALNIAGSRYFVEHAPITDLDDLGRRLRSGELSLAVEASPNFGRDLERGSDPVIGVWIDGAMLTRANTVLGYVQGLHTSHLADFSRQMGRAEASTAVSTGVRYRYNPDVESLKAMVPVVIPLLLIMIPAMFTALGMMREKELGSTTNLYVIPVTHLKFLAGKQLSYAAMGVIDFLLMLVLATVVLRVPPKGSFLALTIGAFPYMVTSIGLGLFFSTFVRSQIAAAFGAAIATMIPAIQFSGLIHPVSSLGSATAWIGKLYPTSHPLVASRGTFSKSLGLSDLWAYYLPLAASIVVLTLLSVACLKKQED